MSLTGDDVRRIVREEITRALGLLDLATEVLNVPYETDRLEQEMLTVVGDVTRVAVKLSRHTPECNEHMREDRYETCICEQGENDE